jgi:membrane-bound lytic murein transglycosylase D
MYLKQSDDQEENKATGTSKHLPKETGICFCVLATMYLYEYHNEHGIKADRAVVQHFATDTVMIKKANVIQTSWTYWMFRFAIAITESYKLNIIPFTTTNHYLRLPTENSSIRFE